MTLQQVLPRLAGVGGANGGFCNTEHLGQCVVTEQTHSNPQHVRFGELGLTILLPNSRASTLISLSRVLRLTAQMQVRGLHADGPVAPVQDALAAWDSATIDAPCGAMCKHPWFTHLEPSIAHLVGGSAGPVPTLVWWRRIARHEVGERFRFSEAFWLATSQWVTMSPLSLVVGITQTHGLHRSITAFNRALPIFVSGLFTGSVIALERAKARWMFNRHVSWCAALANVLTAPFALIFDDHQAIVADGWL